MCLVVTVDTHTTQESQRLMSRPLRSDDPAAWMLIRGIEESNGARPDTGWVTPTHEEIYNERCYICTDPEFALMGLPVCKPCPVVLDSGQVCGVHWAADDSECDNGCDIAGYYLGDNHEYK